jgi:hypothetical protein
MFAKVTTALLYKFFMLNSAKQLSYFRIRSFLENANDAMRVINDNKMNALYDLLIKGTIDQVENQKYVLSPSCIITHKDFTLGVNLSSKLKKSIATYLLQETDYGMTIYSQIPNIERFEILSWNFEFKEVIKYYGNIYSAIKNKLINDVDDVGFKQLERFAPETNNWLPVKEYLPGENLYKSYKFKNHFFYLYHSNRVSDGVSQKINFERYQFSELELIKTMLCLNSEKKQIKYFKEDALLSINEFTSFPLIIEKLLLLNHVLTTGQMPKQRRYKLQSKEFGLLQQLFNNKLTISHAESI